VAEYGRRGGYRGVDGVEIVNYYIDLRVNLFWLTVIEHRDRSYSALYTLISTTNLPDKQKVIIFTVLTNMKINPNPPLHAYAAPASCAFSSEVAADDSCTLQICLLPP
jgi:hypothetical protein